MAPWLKRFFKREPPRQPLRGAPSPPREGVFGRDGLRLSILLQRLPRRRTRGRSRSRVRLRGDFGPRVPVPGDHFSESTRYRGLATESRLGTLSHRAVCRRQNESVSDLRRENGLQRRPRRRTCFRRRPRSPHRHSRTGLSRRVAGGAFVARSQLDGRELRARRAVPYVSRRPTDL